LNVLSKIRGAIKRSLQLLYWQLGKACLIFVTFKEGVGSGRQAITSNISGSGHVSKAY